MYAKYKFTSSRPLKRGNEIDVSKAFKETVKDAIKIVHKSQNLLQIDRGLTFKNKEFNLLLKKYNIKEKNEVKHKRTIRRNNSVVICVVKHFRLKTRWQIANADLTAIILYTTRTY